MTIMIEAMASWFTPTILFCVLNLMIGVVLVTSSLRIEKKQHNQPLGADSSVPAFGRTQSFLQRVKTASFSFPDPFSSPTHHFSDDDPTHQLGRSPSLLQRVRSINLSFSRTDRPDPFPSDPVSSDGSTPQLDRSPSLLQRVRSIKFSSSRLDRPDPLPSVTQFANPHEDPFLSVTQFSDPPAGGTESHVTRSKSDTRVEGPSGEDHMEGHVIRSKSVTCLDTPKKAPAKKTMMKSASEKMAVGEQEEQVDRRRPATVREKAKTTSFGEDEAVDEKADDFINKFRQQLKLQRLDSILRYKEMLNRGVGR